MKKLMLAFGVALAFSTMARASDIAFYVGAPNNTGWYDVASENKDVATIIAKTGRLFKDIQQFDDAHLANFGAWVDAHMNDHQMDIIWLNGCMPSCLYQFPNATPNGSRAELWLNSGHMFINVADWFGYCSYEVNGTRQADNGSTGAANILKLNAAIIAGGGQGTMVVTPTGKQYLPSLNAVTSDRPVLLSAVVAPWEVAAVFAQNAAATYADPVVIHNKQTGGYLAIINQGSTGDWIADRGLTCAEFILNWVNTVVGLANPSLAGGPNPADGAVDVPRDAMLSWTAGQYPSTHDVYFGTVFADVNSASRTTAKSVLVSKGQADTTFDPPGVFAYGQTYYWRIDEVNKSADGTISKGAVWSFTAEPYGYPITGITATASSSAAGMGPENTINGSGLTGDLHGTDGTTMWLSSGVLPNWIQYQFDKVYKLNDLKVWNSNQLIEAFLGFGAKKVTIETSTDGTTWTALANVPDFARAPGLPGYAANTTVSFGGVMAKYVKLTINTSWGGMGITGLSEVRFSYVPVQARAPQPANAATGVAIDATLTWRPGREAGSHKVFFGTDPNAVLNGTVAAKTVADHSYAPSSLNFGTTYYWRVDEVNTVSYPGDVWSFTTQEYGVVDNFESYNDKDNRIYDTWIDGLTDGKSGSQVGYNAAPFAEQTIIHGGKQSMPLEYNNVKTPFYSEAARTFDTVQNWTTNGADTLSLWFQGQAAGFVDNGDGTFTMSSSGTDIWNNGDQFRFAYKTLSGDGAMVARVDSVANTNVWAKAGVMIRQSIDPGSTHAFMPITPGGAGAGNGASFQGRVTANGASNNQDKPAPAIAPPYWVKIDRKGNSFTGSISPDGKTWTALGTPQTITMTNPVLIGLAVCSHDATLTTVAAFSNVSTTGTVTGSWQTAAIGMAMPTNDPAPLYVTVTDKAGKTKTVVNANAAATNVSAWTEWRIPLSSLTGVSLTTVQKITLGVGDKTSPKAGGAGLLFIDDIGYGHPVK